MYAVEAQNLTKVYRIYADPMDRLKEYLLRGRQKYHQEFWALRDASFRAQVGSTVGLIGDNGAGKSTLLQLVAGTLRPTSGSVRLQGRVSTILELGSGFNPEFTGRENVFMSGAIMGIGQREMERRFPEIAAFAEIGEFMNRPVKMYSSGMYVRLAFAVATSVDPDVLIIDEALAVGDHYFQKRCIDRIEGFRKAGKTILFCSHSMYQVLLICDHAIWLHQGRVAAQGEAPGVIATYENYLREREAQTAPTPDSEQTGPKPFPWISRVIVGIDAPDRPRDQFTMGDDVTVKVWYQVPKPPTPVHVGITIHRNDGVQCFGTATHFSRMRPPPRSGVACLILPRLSLLFGEYTISVFLLDETRLHVYDRRLRVVKFRVRETRQAWGICHLEHRWQFEPQSPRIAPTPPGGEGRGEGTGETAP
jgi:ABC-type polysaccharide/polyol phosphate transport system ATPase subunit